MTQFNLRNEDHFLSLRDESNSVLFVGLREQKKLKSCIFLSINEKGFTYLNLLIYKLKPKNKLQLIVYFQI